VYELATLRDGLNGEREGEGMADISRNAKPLPMFSHFLEWESLGLNAVIPILSSMCRRGSKDSISRRRSRRRDCMEHRKFPGDFGDA
jgi:hypothetical protein